MSEQPESSRWILVVALAALLLALPGTSGAARVENRLQGAVLNLSANGATAAALNDLGVRVGAAVTVTFEVESTTPGVVGSAGVEYSDAITGWTVAIGSFRATLDPTQFNFVVVANDAQSSPGLPKVDVYNATGGIDSTDNILGDFAAISMILSEFGNNAIDDGDVDQELNRFDTGALSMAGAGGASISVLFGGDVPAQPPCVRSQISAGAELCRAVLACYAKQAKKPASDLDACIDAAEDRFVVDFDAAQDRADSRGEVCGSVVDGDGAVAELADDVDPLQAIVGEADPDSKQDRKYRSKVYKAASKAVDKALAAYAKDARKPKAKKLAKRLKKNDKKLGKAVKKAGRKAAKKGVAADIDPQDVVDAVNDLVDSVLAVTNGV